MTGNNHQTVPLGSVRTIEVYWFNQAGALATPSTTTWAQRKPSQTEAARTLTLSTTAVNESGTMSGAHLIEYIA